MLSKIIDLIKSLNANAKPGQIAASFCIGLLLGFIPKLNLLWFILFFFFAFVRINKAGYYIFIILGSLLALLLDPVFDYTGYLILNFAPLKNLYSFLLDVPFVGFTKFNNTIVMGSLAWGLILFVPLFFLFILLIKLWRKYVAPKFNKSPLLKALYQIPLIGKLISK